MNRFILRTSCYGSGSVRPTAMKRFISPKYSRRVSNGAPFLLHGRTRTYTDSHGRTQSRYLTVGAGFFNGGACPCQAAIFTKILFLYKAYPRTRVLISEVANIPIFTIRRSEPGFHFKNLQVAKVTYECRELISHFFD